MHKFFLALLITTSIVTQAAAQESAAPVLESAAPSNSVNVSVNIHQKLTAVSTPTTPSITCDLPGGSVVADLSFTGGNGNPVAYSITGGDTTDFAIGTNPTNNSPAIVVVPAGITSASDVCAAIPAFGAVTATLTIKPSQ